MAVATFVAGACGSAEQPRAEPSKSPPAAGSAFVLPDAPELGACPPDLAVDEANHRLDVVPAPSRVLAAGLAWWWAGGISAAAGGGEGDVPVSVTDARPVVGAAPPKAIDSVAYHAGLPQYAAAVERGHELLVALDGRARVQLVVAADETGRVAFVGSCEHTALTVPFAAQLESRRARLGALTPLDVVLGIATGDARGKAALDGWGDDRTLTWAETDPAHRSIDLERMPADVAAALRRVPVTVAFPSPWRARPDLTLCTRTALAWGECTALDVDPPTTPVRTVGAVLDGQDLEVWLLDGPARFDPPVATLATVPWDVVRAHLAAGTAVALRPLADIASMDDLVARARGGVAVLERA